MSYLKNDNKNKLYTIYNQYKPSEEYYKLIGEDPNNYIEEIKNGKNLPTSNPELELFFGIINLPENPIFHKINSRFYMSYPDENLQFDGKVYVLIGNKTCSSASLFALIIKDNDYGEIVGEPTGSGSISHPKGIKFLSQNSGLQYMLSVSTYIRAKEEALINEPDAVYPDVYISTTFKDYLNGVDPCWEYLVENVFNKENE